MKNTVKNAFKSPKLVVGFTLFLLILLASILIPVLSHCDPLQISTGTFAPPGKQYLLGADNFGRNEFIELFFGIATSLKIGLIAGVIATLVGLVIGLLSGYIGGTLDDVLMFITNIFIVIPQFIILVLVSTSITSRSYVVTALVIAFTGWPWTARAVRSQTISLRNRDHVNLAKLSGYSTAKIIVREILPYLASYVMMAFILQVASGILNEAQISMLGLGPQHVATLGLMLNWATQFEALSSGAWWAFMPPVIMIALCTFSLNLMNTGLDQVFNPQLRG